MKKTPEDIIYYIGDHITQSGYPCLISAVKQCLKLGRYPHRQLMELIYKPAAQELGISLERFNRAIGRATQDIWDRRSHKERRAPSGGGSEAFPQGADPVSLSVFEKSIDKRRGSLPAFLLITLF